MEAESHSQIMLAIGEMRGELKRGIEGTNHRLDTLNSSVAKHEIRLGGQDVLNAQMTMSQTQIVEELKTLRISNTENTLWRVRVMGIGIGVSLLIGALGFLFWKYTDSRLSFLSNYDTVEINNH